VSFLFLEAYSELILFDFYVGRDDFQGLYRRVRNSRVAQKACSPDAAQLICRAVDLACIWYWKEALCLQRSAAAACLLKRHGVAAELVIGTQQIPFKAHAWVEVAGAVVNDRPYTPEMYQVLDRC
jgi:prolyl oligopeptidase